MSSIHYKACDLKDSFIYPDRWGCSITKLDLNDGNNSTDDLDPLQLKGKLQLKLMSLHDSSKSLHADLNWFHFNLKK